MDTKRELRESIRQELQRDRTWQNDEQRMREWFRSLYDRDYDCEPDGMYSGRDSRVGLPLARAIQAATPCQQCIEEASMKTGFVDGVRSCPACGSLTFGENASGWRPSMGWFGVM